jgi:hypothetical protein
MDRLVDGISVDKARWVTGSGTMRLSEQVMNSARGVYAWAS